MQFSEMVQEVMNIVQDSSFDDFIPGYVNEAFLQASGRIDIPDLKRVGVANTVTGQMYTSLAGLQSGFSGRLSKVLDSTIIRFRNVEELTDWIISNERLLTEEGPVEAVALEGKTLWYFPTPTISQAIPCLLYSNPALLVADEDVPNFVPEICHRNIGIHGAVFLASIVAENGIDGEKVDSNYNYQLFEKGITQLSEWVGKNRINTISSTFNDDTTSTTQWGSMFTRWTNVR
jgi:hypothetical protein